MDWPLLRAESGFQKIKARTEEANYFRDLHFVLVMKDEFPVNVVNLTCYPLSSEALLIALDSRTQCFRAAERLLCPPSFFGFCQDRAWPHPGLSGHDLCVALRKAGAR
jgi:hypothetical protein